MRQRSQQEGSDSDDISDAVVMVRRSSIAACVTCGLCGCFLREATTISECLHSFCRECIVDEITDKDINHCPKCGIDLGCDPLAKLRADRSLQCISSMIFPAKCKMEEFSSVHPELASPPSLASQPNEAYHSGYKMDAHLVGDPMNTVNTTTEGRTALSPATSQSEAEKSAARILEMIEVYIGQTQTLEAKTAIGREFEERLEKQTERLQSESKYSQETVAAQREVLRENRALKLEIVKKNEELSNLKNNYTMIEKRSIQVEQRNTVLEDQIERVNRLLEAEKSNARKLNEQLGKAVDEKNKLLTQLETYKDGLAKIQGCIHKSLTARISRLKDVAATTNLGHYQHLLARMDALGQVKEYLPNMLETIEVATSLSAYSLAAAMLIRFRAYHGDDFDLQRLVMPLHLNSNRQDYARIRNAIDPLAAQVAQKYIVCEH